MVSIAATKIWVLSPLERFEVQIFLRLLRAVHADAFLSLRSLSVLSILYPRYLKSLTCFRGSPLLAMSGPWLFTWNAMYSVFLAFRCSPVCLHSASTLESTSSQTHGQAVDNPCTVHKQCWKHSSLHPPPTQIGIHTGVDHQPDQS